MLSAEKPRATRKLTWNSYTAGQPKRPWPDMVIVQLIRRYFRNTQDSCQPFSYSRSPSLRKTGTMPSRSSSLITACSIRFTPAGEVRLMINYRWTDARKDLLAGVTVAAISLPQAMAYALIAGVDPRFGLYSAIVITLVASIFGSSSHLINGPTNAISLVVFSALAFFSTDAHLQAYQAMFLLGIMIGCIQILIAVFKLGDLTRFTSESVVIGFMAGAGTLVAITQIGNLTGMPDRGTGLQHVLYRVWMTVRHGHINPRGFGIGLSTIVLAVALRKLARKFHLPQFDMLMALIIAALVAAAFGWSKPGIDGKTIITT